MTKSFVTVGSLVALLLTLCIWACRQAPFAETPTPEAAPQTDASARLTSTCSWSTVTPTTSVTVAVEVVSSSLLTGMYVATPSKWNQQALKTFFQNNPDYRAILYHPGCDLYLVTIEDPTRRLTPRGGLTLRRDRVVPKWAEVGFSNDISRSQYEEMSVVIEGLLNKYEKELANMSEQKQLQFIREMLSKQGYKVPKTSSLVLHEDITKLLATPTKRDPTITKTSLSTAGARVAYYNQLTGRPFILGLFGKILDWFD